MKLNIKYEWYIHQRPIISVLNEFKKNNRKIKRFLKMQLSTISKTLNNSDWDVVFHFTGHYPKNVTFSIDVKAQNKKIQGDLKLINDKENSFKIFIDYSSSLNLFLESLRNKHNSGYFYLVINDFPLNAEENLTFDIVEEDKITRFKNKHEGFLKNIHNNEYFIFDDYYFVLQLFFVNDEIYWRSSYLLNPGTSNFYITKVRNIKQNSEKDFIMSMIEAKFINVIDDINIEEVLSWSVKDIFAMSRLLGY